MIRGQSREQAREEALALLRSMTPEESAAFPTMIADLAEKHGLGGAIRRAVKKLRKRRKRAAQGGAE